MVGATAEKLVASTAALMVEKLVEHLALKVAVQKAA